MGAMFLTGLLNKLGSKDNNNVNINAVQQTLQQGLLGGAAGASDDMRQYADMANRQAQQAAAKQNADMQAQAQMTEAQGQQLMQKVQQEEEAKKKMLLQIGIAAATGGFGGGAGAGGAAGGSASVLGHPGIFIG